MTDNWLLDTDKLARSTRSLPLCGWNCNLVDEPNADLVLRSHPRRPHGRVRIEAPAAAHGIDAKRANRQATITADVKTQEVLVVSDALRREHVFAMNAEELIDDHEVRAHEHPAADAPH